MRIHTLILPCERDWCTSMKARTVGADEHLAGDLHHILMDERNEWHRAGKGTAAAAGAVAASAEPAAATAFRGVWDSANG